MNDYSNVKKTFTCAQFAGESDIVIGREDRRHVEPMDQDN